MICPHCKREVPDGNFCSNCSKPLHPKWYQKKYKDKYSNNDRKSDFYDHLYCL